MFIENGRFESLNHRYVPKTNSLWEEKTFSYLDLIWPTTIFATFPFLFERMNRKFGEYNGMKRKRFLDSIYSVTTKF